MSSSYYQLVHPSSTERLVKPVACVHLSKIGVSTPNLSACQSGDGVLRSRSALNDRPSVREAIVPLTLT